MKGTKSVYLVGMRNWEKWEKDKIVNKRTANILGSETKCENEKSRSNYITKCFLLMHKDYG